MAFDDVDPIALARAVAIDTAGDPEQVGEFVTGIEFGDHVTDFRFTSHKMGYEGWQWSITMFHDEELNQWTVDESTLIPTDSSLLPPPWIPWKDRLEPSDLNVTDSIGTQPDDPRLEDGVNEATVEEITATVAADGSTTDESDVAEAISDFDLSRRRVLSPLGRSQTAQRWYEGPHGPKSLSTKIADGNTCSTCGFFIPLRGELNLMFGVCANRWSPDDGRVVSLDHGCGEHSAIEPPEPSQLWIQTKPAFDNLHVDIVEQRERDENAQLELLDQLNEDSEDNTESNAKVVSEEIAVNEETESSGEEAVQEQDIDEAAQSSVEESTQEES